MRRTTFLTMRFPFITRTVFRPTPFFKFTSWVIVTGFLPVCIMVACSNTYILPIYSLIRFYEGRDCLVTKMIDERKDNRVDRSNRVLGATRGETQENTGCQQKEENSDKQGHIEVKHLLYLLWRF